MFFLNTFLNNIRISLILLFSLFFYSCDFTPRIHQQILVAQKYIINQEYQKAVKQYQQILDNVPQIDIKIKINYQLGELYSISLGQFEKGILFYEKIRKLTSIPLWIVKAEERIGEINYIYLKNYKKSLVVYRKLSEFQPQLKKVDLYEYRYIMSLIELNYVEKAIKMITKIQKNASHQYYINSFFMKGTLYFQNKKWEKAIFYLKEYIKKEKRKDRSLKAKFLLANAYETSEKLKMAYNIYYSMLGEYPNTKVIQDRLNSVYKRRIYKRR